MRMPEAPVHRLTVHIIGVRGVGKTTLMNAFHRILRSSFPQIEIVLKEVNDSKLDLLNASKHAVLLLCDLSENLPHNFETIWCQQLHTLNVPFVIVGTKNDKSSIRINHQDLSRIAIKYKNCSAMIISSMRGTNIQQLLNRIVVRAFPDLIFGDAYLERSLNSELHSTQEEYQSILRMQMGISGTIAPQSPFHAHNANLATLYSGAMPMSPPHYTPKPPFPLDAGRSDRSADRNARQSRAPASAQVPARASALDDRQPRPLVRQDNRLLLADNMDDLIAAQRKFEQDGGDINSLGVNQGNPRNREADHGHEFPIMEQVLEDHRPVPPPQGIPAAAPRPQLTPEQQEYTRNLEIAWTTAGQNKPIAGDRMVAEKTISALHVYTDHNFFMRLVKGHWGRHHISTVDAVINDLQQTVDNPPAANANSNKSYEALRKLQQIRLVNGQGTLSTTIKFLEKKIPPPAAAGDDDDVPPSFICPITHEMMKKPVVDQFGHSYEGEALQSARMIANVSPLTSQPYTQPANQEFIVNFALLPLIEAHKKKAQAPKENKARNAP